MKEFIFTVLKISAPLLFAVLGALITEYTGVLAVFIEGAIILSAFFCTLFTIITGSQIFGFIFAAGLTSFILFALAIFTFKTKSNPFLTGLALNLFAAGFVPCASELFLSKPRIISFEEFSQTQTFTPINNFFPFFTAVFFSVLLSLFLKCTSEGICLRYSGEAPEALTARGKNYEAYKIFSWTAAGFFSACAGSTLVFRLAAYTPNISAGKGWTALAAVFLGNKNPLLCAGAVLVFSSAEYAVNIMQGVFDIPTGILLSFPYVAALLCLIIPHALKRNRLTK